MGHGIYVHIKNDEWVEDDRMTNEDKLKVLNKTIKLAQNGAGIKEVTALEKASGMKLGDIYFAAIEALEG